MALTRGPFTYRFAIHILKIYMYIENLSIHYQKVDLNPREGFDLKLDASYNIHKYIILNFFGDQTLILRM